MRHNPFDIIKHRLVTEKAKVLESMQHTDSNPCIRKFDLPKYVFVVHPKATKPQIAEALETIYQEKKAKVKKVNTVLLKPKPKRVRGRKGKTKMIKKAIVTFEKGDILEDQI